ncbi:MAG TPA: hypothetical protein PLF13_10400 [candidate division Zixibacteria bacterium]|nr:hypothetical protein [candidate division Zixibacteria bacterium]
MRKLVLLVCMAAVLTATASLSSAGVIPSWENRAGNVGFFPITNEVSLFQNYDDPGNDRGRTIQIVSINSFKLFTEFTFEFTADYNFDFSSGLDRDHYVELSLVKPVWSIFSLNYQRILSTFEPDAVNQFGLRLSL